MYALSNTVYDIHLWFVDNKRFSMQESKYFNNRIEKLGSAFG